MKKDTYVTRLKSELDDLAGRLTKLNEYTGSKAYSELESSERALLQLQARQMTALLATLTVRYSPYVEDLPEEAEDKPE